MFCLLHNSKSANQPNVSMYQSNNRISKEIKKIIPEKKIDLKIHMI